jgi:hypothetical protein
MRLPQMLQLQLQLKTLPPLLLSLARPTALSKSWVALASRSPNGMLKSP